MLSSSVFYQRQKRNPVGKLSLVALMDIFTILVFFLLLNSGEAEKIQNAKFVKLPDSSVGTAPHKEVTIFIGAEELWFADQFVTRVEDISLTKDNTIESLSAAMIDHVAKRTELTEFEKQSGFAVTIMGDQRVPFSLVKSVMETCQENNFRNVSLAVNHIVGEIQPAGSVQNIVAVGAGGEK